MKGCIKVCFTKEYNMINLPKDAIIADIICRGKDLIIYYTSESGEIYFSNGEFGFEYYIFREDQDVEVKIVMQCEKRAIVYAKVVDCQKEKVLAIIATWKQTET